MIQSKYSQSEEGPLVAKNGIIRYFSSAFGGKNVHIHERTSRGEIYIRIGD